MLALRWSMYVGEGKEEALGVQYNSVWTIAAAEEQEHVQGWAG